MDNFTKHKLYYYDDNDDQIKFAKNKSEVKEEKKRKTPQRANSKIIIIANRVLEK